MMVKYRGSEDVWEVGEGGSKVGGGDGGDSGVAEQDE